MSNTAINQRMDTTPIPQLIMKSSVPLMISTLVSSLYGLVDSMFVARISEKALTATTIAFPITLFLFAIAIGTGMGVNSRLSRYLGEGDIENAKETGFTALILCGLSALPFMLISLFGLPFIFSLLTKDPEIWAMGQTYSHIVLLFCLGQFFASVGGRLLQATGYATLSMVTQLTGSILNCILDPIMIFGLLGFPALGIEGAAFATVIAQTVSGVFSILLYFVKNPALRPEKKNLHIRLDLIKEIYRVGVPVMIMTSLNSVLMMVTNRLLENVSGTAIAFYGIFGKLQNFMFMPINGLSQGIVPIIGYFFGAKNTDKIHHSIHFALKMGIAIMAFGSIIFLLFPIPLMSIFSPSAEMIEMGQVGLRMLALSFIPLAFLQIYGNTFTALGNGMLNMKCSLIKGILPIPLLLLFIHLLGTSWCWFAFVLADLIASIVSIREFNKLDKHLICNL